MGYLAPDKIFENMLQLKRFGFILYDKYRISDIVINGANIVSAL